MGSEIVDLVKGFTDQANENSRSENIRNLKELKSLKNQVDEGLQAAGMAPKPMGVPSKDETSNEETLIPNIGGMILERQNKDRSDKKKTNAASAIEQDLLSKIKSKDSLIAEIDAQIKRLDKME